MDQQRDAIVSSIMSWYAQHSRDLPWRSPSCSAWGVLVSEVMLQQTPVARVLPAWTAWMARWPEPADLASAPVADLLRAWDRLGYPRRALRLRQAAAVIVDQHHGVVPADEPALRALPGVGEYTAAAVASFAYKRRTLVLDTNVRRVLGRIDAGLAMPRQSLTLAERERAAAYLPTSAVDAACWNAAAMELGALICRARHPRCSHCPAVEACAWRNADYPATAASARTQDWEGTDRQCRGRIMAAACRGGIARADAVAFGVDVAQGERCLAGLIDDGLIAVSDDVVHLPADET